MDDIDQDKINASFENEVLNVSLPKSPAAQQKVRRIAITLGPFLLEPEIPSASFRKQTGMGHSGALFT
jgi:hypothetical protein